MPSTACGGSNVAGSGSGRGGRSPALMDTDRPGLRARGLRARGARARGVRAGAICSQTAGGGEDNCRSNTDMCCARRLSSASEDTAATATLTRGKQATFHRHHLPVRVGIAVGLLWLAAASMPGLALGLDNKGQSWQGETPSEYRLKLPSLIWTFYVVTIYRYVSWLCIKWNVPKQQPDIYTHPEVPVPYA